LSPGRAAALLALALGCVRAPPPDLSADPAELLAAVRAREARVLRVAGSARLRLESPEGSGTLDALAAAERPDRLRLELLDFFGGPVALLVAAGGRFAFLDARSGVWYRGAATPENLSRVVSLRLSVEELAAAACGSPLLVDGGPRSARPGDGVMELVLGGEGLEQRLEVGAGAAVESSRIVRRGPGGPAEPVGPDLDFASFRWLGGLRVPGTVRLAQGARQAELRWKGDLTVNAPADPALFAVAVPAGARVVELPAGTPPPRLVLPRPGE
jgi:hypothetical protein